MSVYPNVTNEEIISLEKSAEQQKNEKARKIKCRIIKQTYDAKLAETFEPITEKLDRLVEATKELDPKNSVNAFVLEPPPGVAITDELITALVLMAKNKNKFKIVKDNRNRAMIKDVFVNVWVRNDVKIGDNIYELTPETQKALT